jgi:hypothetical protein
VTAVIQDNVGHTKLLNHLTQKNFIRLIADTNVNLVLTELFALGPQVYPHDSGVRAQVPLPHLQRPAFAATYLEENHVSIHELREMALVSGKIVLPLVNKALIICQKVRPEAHEGMVLALPFPKGKSRRRPSSGVVGERQEEQNFISNRLSADHVGSYPVQSRSWRSASPAEAPAIALGSIRYQLKNAGKLMSLRGIIGHITSDLSEGLFQELRRLLTECQFQ